MVRDSAIGRFARLPKEENEVFFCELRQSGSVLGSSDTNPDRQYMAESALLGSNAQRVR